MPERFAIYFSPAVGTPLRDAGSAWFGRDAAGAPVRPLLSPLEQDLVDRHVAKARRYSFHATLRAPMALLDGFTRPQLETAAERFAAAETPARLGPLKVDRSEGFLALVPVTQEPTVTDLVARLVEHFEPYRAPLTDGDRQRRMQKQLTPRQRELLERYGYPQVMEQFRFHITLSDGVDSTTADRLSQLAGRVFAPALATPLALNRIALFHEPAAGEPFREVAGWPLTGGEPRSGQNVDQSKQEPGDAR